jgi:hypothetical protein
VLGSALTGDMRSLITLAGDESTAPARVESRVAAPVAIEPPRQRGSATSAVIAGVGVLLLAMGVGVLIGRSGQAAKVSTQPQPQVISVATPGADSGTSTASHGSSPTTSSAKHSSAKHGSSKSSSSESSTAPPAGGVGQTPSKPAPPSVAEHLKGVKGGSYEQKSKNLPNVISTG